MSYMFKNCSISSLPDILSKYNTTNIIDMSFLFCNCLSLTSIPDLSNWNVNKVIDMSNMFYNCRKLLNIPCFKKVKDVIWITSIFSFCTSLITISDISEWDIGNVEDMNGLFKNCTSLI